MIIILLPSAGGSLKEIRALFLQVFLLVREAKVLQLRKAMSNRTKVYANIGRHAVLRLTALNIMSKDPKEASLCGNFDIAACSEADLASLLAPF